jgi:protoporphyrinogen oxidase
MKERSSVVVIGAGPAGLTSGYELARNGFCPTLLEKSGRVGGLARTETYKGYRFDMGGHRFFTKAERIQALWEEMLGDDFRKVPRLSRIFYRGRFFKYPLELFDTFTKLGIIESGQILMSYVRARIHPHPEEKTLEQWLTNRFGRRLYETFFRSYTEKVWGISCDRIGADWADQRIRGLSLAAAVLNALFKNSNGHPKTLISEFHYPPLGPGMMWERFQRAIEERGGSVTCRAEVTRLNHAGGHIEAVSVREDGREKEIAGNQFISSMSLEELISRFDPPPPAETLQAARELSYRGFVLVGLILNRADLFSDNWIYIHSPEVKVARIQNFKNWSPAMVASPLTTSLGMEYFCSEGDPTWRMTDRELVELAKREIVHLGLADPGDVEEGIVFRQARAYPVYDHRYREHLERIQRFLETIDNLQTIGRSGMHRYNNMDHSMITGILAAENILGARHDLWEVNRQQEYLE